MVKGLLKLAYAVATISLCAIGFLAPGCSSDDSAAAPAADGSAHTDPGTCQLEGAHNGGPCFPVGPALCFQECVTGGCVCTKDTAHPGADAGIWVCTVDHSCEPDSSPIDDFDAPFNPPDSSFDDASDAGTGDAADGSDADAS